MSPVDPTTSPFAGIQDVRVDADDDIEATELDEDGQPPPSSGVGAPDWSVQVFKAERSVFELYRRYQQNLLKLDPGFQRDDVWKAHARSRLIESVLARIPLPAIYLSQEDEEHMLVVDGRQRLTTLFRFLNGEFSLRGLDLLPQFEGKRFTDLDARMQRRVEDTALTTFIIQPGSDPQVKFHLFERLNRGGVELRPQEIRNGIYRGPGLEMLDEIAPLLREVAGENRRYKHMKDKELALRCCAMVTTPLEDYSGEIEGFLNSQLIALNAMSDPDRLDHKQRTVDALRAVRAAFQECAFVRYRPEREEWGSHLNLAVMDLQVIGFDRIRRPASYWGGVRPLLLDRLRELHCSDPEFLGSVLYSTSARARLSYRVETWLKVLQDVVDNHP